MSWLCRATKEAPKPKGAEVISSTNTLSCWKAFRLKGNGQMGGTSSKEWRREPKPPNLRDKLSQAFLTAFDADFNEHGVDVIQQLREKDPVRYAELAGRLITAAAQPGNPDDYSRCQTEEEICQKLLQQVGINPDAITPDMLRQAEGANTNSSPLLVIAEGN